MPIFTSICLHNAIHSNNLFEPHTHTHTPSPLRTYTHTNLCIHTHTHLYIYTHTHTGSPLLYFGDGQCSANPICEVELADYLIDCALDPQGADMLNQTRDIGKLRSLTYTHLITLFIFLV